jgi:hypothetical protein
MFGNVSVPLDARTVSAVDFILHLAQLITNRDEVAASIKELAAQIKEARAVGAEIERREQQVLHREQQAAAHEQALAKREQGIVEREDAAHALQHRVEKQRAEFAELRAQVRKSLAA